MCEKTPRLDAVDRFADGNRRQTIARSLMLLGYYYGTLGIRRLRNRAALAEGRAPITVLFYHRVADWCAGSLTISNRDFERQIGWLSRHFDLVSLEDAQRRIAAAAGNAGRFCVSITFDDGYADNCRRAIPLLIEKRIPCVYFVTTRNLATGEPFFDRRGGLALASNTIEEVRAMAASGVEIGAHSESHSDLASIATRSRLEREIRDAGRRLEDCLGRRVRYFAFPFGQHANLSSTAFDVAREAGYEAVCSAYGGYNFPGDDPFHIQRIHADSGMIRLKNRVTFDPRMARTPRFRYLAP